MRQVQQEIKELRSKIADKYSDRLADDMHNMTGCLAQQVYELVTESDIDIEVNLLDQENLNLCIV